MKKQQINIADMQYVAFYFISYCKARAHGWDDLAEAMLNALHDHGYDIKLIDGKHCLVPFVEVPHGRK